MNKQAQVGMTVVFMNEVREEQDALVTAVHGTIAYDDSGKMLHAPCLNLVFVSTDQSKRDAYGVQIERKSSVVHRSSHAYHESVNGSPVGMTWRFVDEQY